MKLDSGLSLLAGPLTIAHFGLSDVTNGAEAASARVERLPFVPPARGDLQRIQQLSWLQQPAQAERIAQANEQALQQLLDAHPRLVGVGVARDVIPGLDEGLFLHAGPPITWDRMSGPLRGAIIGGLLLERKAQNPGEAEQLAASGAIRFEPCHRHHAVGPMAGVITPSMPVWIVEDQASGIRAFCTLNEGLGKVMRYGAYGPEVIERLGFMARVLGPVIGETLAQRGPVDLKLLMAQALQMGDEGHNRNRAGTSLLFRELAPTMVKLGRDATQISQVLSFIHGNDHFFLNLTMPMAKCLSLCAEGVEQSSLVTVMARNGTDFGIQLSCLPGQWFIGPAQTVQGLFFPGYSEKDANPDIGDSAITETMGIGAFAMACAPAIVQFIGGTADDALSTSRRMGDITLGRNPAWCIPQLGFVGVPTGIDLRKVMELSQLPTINTGIAHREPGVGQIGAGLTAPPWECFEQALDGYFAHCRQPTTT